ncbi:hypothetical protein [Dyella sp. Tek66A03]|uniref:hypothetical protein n=1 Tax=Dyella sp. Tek66A03 TaxID=3458298 RepID=UPI00403E8D18
MSIRLPVVLLIALCVLPLRAAASDTAPATAADAQPDQGSLCMSAHAGGCGAREIQAEGSTADARFVHCDLHSASFSRCLASAAPNVVRRDPNKPAAVAAFKISVKDDVTGAVTDTTVLAATSTDIADAIGAMHFSLKTQVEDDGGALVGFRFSRDGEVSGSKDFRIGDTHSIALDHTTVTIARL